MRKSQGFTLIELMVTIAVLAIVAMIAAPSFGNMVAKQRLNILARDFADLITDARGQAIASRKNITIKLECPTGVDQLPVCPENTPTLYHWDKTAPDTELKSLKLDIVFSGIGLAKQRTRMIDNPLHDPNEEEDLDADPPVNPEKIQEIVPLEFTFCNSKIKQSRTVFVSNVGTVDRIESGVCS
ncbi:prepilin-type N-terminal cleavage/methylation domain-containing protein [Acinetobacter indicus]|uniref:pilus assembly FimT family protein n=1 Tax=Acinetobacter indicus TaxID=756892 RepID=UPI000CEC370C|nr:prepilin-type N-terminal cleavage/methylation domain-containing protein [Acinetobacter indicus]MDM1276961.1 prepilin-type N-terminal cleavage/methylation domain-containing protein [Acinetobacter indicus]